MTRQLEVLTWRADSHLVVDRNRYLNDGGVPVGDLRRSLPGTIVVGRATVYDDAVRMARGDQPVERIHEASPADAELPLPAASRLIARMSTLGWDYGYDQEPFRVHVRATGKGRQPMVWQIGTPAIDPETYLRRLRWEHPNVEWVVCAVDFVDWWQCWAQVGTVVATEPHFRLWNIPQEGSAAGMRKRLGNVRLNWFQRGSL